MYILLLIIFVLTYVALKNMLTPAFSKLPSKAKKIKDLEEIEMAKKREQIIKSKPSRIKRLNSRLSDLMLQANMKLKLEEFYILSIFSGILGWLCGGIMKNQILSLIMFFAFSAIPYMYINALAMSYRAKIQGDPLEHALSMIIATLLQKNDVITSIKDNLNKIDEPLRGYFIEFVNNVEKLGIPYRRAISDLSKKINCVDFSNFARLSIIFDEKGGDTKYTLMNIPDDMRDKKLIQSEVSSDVDSVNMLGIIFGLLVPLTVLGLKITSRDFYLILTDTVPGKITIAIVSIIMMIFVYLIILLNRSIKTL